MRPWTIKGGFNMKLYTIEEVAEILIVCTETVKRYIREGKLRAVKLSNKVIRIPEVALNDFIESHMIGGRV